MEKRESIEAQKRREKNHDEMEREREKEKQVTCYRLVYTNGLAKER